MAKIGRNEPCRCGSGKKYKKCCEAGDRLLAAEFPPVYDADPLDEDVSVLDDVRETVRGILHTGRNATGELADRISDLIEARNFDEAEEIARQIEVERPDDHGGTECLALVSFARGLRQVAADHLRRAVASMDARGEGNFCNGCRDRMVLGILDLDPDGPIPIPERRPT